MAGMGCLALCAWMRMVCTRYTKATFWELDDCCTTKGWEEEVVDWILCCNLTIWLERNNRVFQNKGSAVQEITNRSFVLSDEWIGGAVFGCWWWCWRWLEVALPISVVSNLYLVVLMASEFCLLRLVCWAIYFKKKKSRLNWCISVLLMLDWWLLRIVIYEYEFLEKFDEFGNLWIMIRIMLNLKVGRDLGK